jgi:hypothetical protein
VFRYRSAEHFIEVFRTYYGPTLKAFAALDAEGQAGLARDLTELLERFNQGGPRTLSVPANTSRWSPSVADGLEETCGDIARPVAGARIGENEDLITATGVTPGGSERGSH